MFETFPRLGERRGQLAGSLSGGEQQMLAIGRALMGNPRVLLLDEPSEGLAPQIVHEIGRIIAGLKAEGLSIILVEQNVQLALRLADEVAIINTGRVVRAGAGGGGERARRCWSGIGRVAHARACPAPAADVLKTWSEDRMAEESNHYGAHRGAAGGPAGARGAAARASRSTCTRTCWCRRRRSWWRPHVDLRTVPLAHFATPTTQALNRKQDADRRPNMTDLGIRLADMDAAGIDVQIVMPPPPQCTYTVETGLGAEAAAIVNEGMRDWCKQQPDRFAALGTVPMQDPEAAVRELRRCMRELGLKGVQILTNVAGKELSDPEFAPVLGGGGGAGRGGAAASQRVHGGGAAAAVLLQQRHRQPARYQRSRCIT